MAILVLDRESVAGASTVSELFPINHPTTLHGVFFHDGVMYATGQAPTARSGSSRPTPTPSSGFGPTITLAACVESDDGDDLTAEDDGIPPPGEVFHYLVRAENACPSGVGPLGSGWAVSTWAGPVREVGPDQSPPSGTRFSFTTSNPSRPSVTRIIPSIGTPESFVVMPDAGHLTSTRRMRVAAPRPIS